MWQAAEQDHHRHSLSLSISLSLSLTTSDSISASLICCADPDSTLSAPGGTPARSASSTSANAAEVEEVGGWRVEGSNRMSSGQADSFRRQQHSGGSYRHVQQRVGVRLQQQCSAHAARLCPCL